MLDALPKGLRRWFDDLYARCTELREIAGDLTSTTDARAQPNLSDLQLESLDRLLWPYLKLLFTEYSLSCFFDETDRERMQLELRRLEQ